MAALVCSNCLTITKTPDVNLGKSAKCPKCGTAEKIVPYETGELCTGKIVMGSGVTHSFNAIYMVPLDLAQKAQDLYAEAARKFTPKSLGIGFIGDIGFVAAASLASSAIEGIATKISASGGVSLLEQYAKVRLALRYSGTFCKLDAIKQIQFADPTLWAWSHISSGVLTTYTVPDDAFICIRLADGSPTSIRWESVEEYWVPMK